MRAFFLSGIIDQFRPGDLGDPLVEGVGVPKILQLFHSGGISVHDDILRHIPIPDLRKNIAEHNVLGKRVKLSVGTLIPLLVCPHLLCNISVLNSCRDSHNAHSFLRLWKTAANSAVIMNRIPTFAGEKGSPVLGIPFSFLRSMRP